MSAHYSPAIREIAQALANELTPVSSVHEVRLELGNEPAPLAILDELVHRELGLDDEDGQISLVFYCFDQAVAVVMLDNEPMGAADKAARLAHAADQLQDHVIDCLEAAWPKCPDHDHPLTASLRGAVAVWVCPATGSVYRRIGEV